MLPTATHSDLPSSSPRSRLALIRDAVPDTPRQAGINPLIDAASPIFSYLRVLRTMYHNFPDVALIKKNLEKKLKIFMEKIQKEMLHEDHAVLCHYAVCATIDDVMQQACAAHSAQSAAEWRNERFLLALESTPETSMRFFVILEHMMQSPEFNLHVLELFYLCTALGYIGPYRRSLQYHEYQRIVDQLYKTIRMHRTPVEHPSFTLPVLQIDHEIISAVPFRFLFVAFGICLISCFALGYEFHAEITHILTSI